MVYTVEGDNVIKQTAQNVADPEILNATPEDVKSFIEESTKAMDLSKVLNKRLKSKMEKLKLRSRSTDFSVASISELRKVNFPEEYYLCVSFSNSKSTGKWDSQKRRTNLLKFHID